jgi:hypothetical protein
MVNPVNLNIEGQKAWRKARLLSFYISSIRPKIFEGESTAAQYGSQHKQPT